MNKHVAVRRFGISILLAGAAVLTSVAFSSAASADDTKGSVNVQKAPITKTSYTPRFDHIEHHPAVILHQAGRAGDRVVRNVRNAESSRAPAAAARRDSR